MLEPDQWELVLSQIRGVTYRGTERVASATILDAVHVADDQPARAKAGKLIVSTMRRLGWTGPKMIRISAGTCVQGYWRLPHALPMREEIEDDEPDGPLADDLPQALEHGTRLAIRKLVRVLRIPTKGGDGNLMRSQVTAAGIMINAQLRADEQRLRAKVTGDTLERLLRAIEKERPKIVEGGAGEAEAFSLADLSGE